MDTKDLLNDSSIHHGRNLARLMNKKGLKVEDLEKALQLSQKQVEELMEMKKIDDEMLDKLAKALDDVKAGTGRGPQTSKTDRRTGKTNWKTKESEAGE